MKQVLTNINLNSVNSSLKVSPNPTTDKITIEINALQEEEYSLTIYSLDGKELISKHFPALKGINRYVQDLGEIAKGAYLLSIQNKAAIERIKLIKQ